MVQGGGTYADPWVLECLAGGDPFAGIHRQHLIDEILGLWRDGVPFWAWVLRDKRGNGFTYCL